MLEQLSEQVRECYRCAAEARAKADATADPALKQSYLDIERRWLLLARSHLFTESLENFVEHGKRGTERVQVDPKKNILPTVRATVNLSHFDRPDGLKQAIEGRIKALARVHPLFAQSGWVGAELSVIVKQELMPCLRDGEPRARIDGPSLVLAPKTAQTVAVILHELSTNAAKYGSLSVPHGHAEVTWSRAVGGRLILYWTEGGGPFAKKPKHQGFRTSIIDQMIQELIIDRMIQDIKGEMHRDWRSEGLACRIVLQSWWT